MSFMTQILSLDPLSMVVAYVTLLFGVSLLAAAIFPKAAAVRNCILFSAFVCSFVGPTVLLGTCLTGYAIHVPVAVAEPVFETARIDDDSFESSPLDIENQSQWMGPSLSISRHPHPDIASGLQTETLFSESLGGTSAEISPLEPVESSSPLTTPELYGVDQTEPFHVLDAEFGQPNLQSNQYAITPVTPYPFKAAIVLFWILGTLFFLFGIVISLFRIQVLLKKVEPIDRTKYSLALRRAAINIGLPSYPRIGLSDDIEAPAAVGMSRNAWVLMPRNYLESMSHDQLVHVLTHEGAHVVRRDPLLQVLQRINLALWWWNPLAYVLNSQLGRAREEICDNFVIRKTAPDLYGATLLELGKMISMKTHLISTVSLFGSRWKLEDRIKELLNPRRKTMIQVNKSVFTMVLAAFVCLSAVVGASRLKAQDPKQDDKLAQKQDQQAAELSQRLEAISLALSQQDGEGEKSEKMAKELAKKAKRVEEKLRDLEKRASRQDSDKRRTKRDRAAQSKQDAKRGQKRAKARQMTERREQEEAHQARDRAVARERQMVERHAQEIRQRQEQAGQQRRQVEQRKQREMRRSPRDDDHAREIAQMQKHMSEHMAERNVQLSRLAAQRAEMEAQRAKFAAEMKHFDRELAERLNDHESEGDEEKAKKIKMEMRRRRAQMAAHQKEMEREHHRLSIEFQKAKQTHAREARKLEDRVRQEVDRARAHRGEEQELRNARRQEELEMHRMQQVRERESARETRERSAEELRRRRPDEPRRVRDAREPNDVRRRPSDPRQNPREMREPRDVRRPSQIREREPRADQEFQREVMGAIRELSQVVKELRREVDELRNRDND